MTENLLLAGVPSAAAARLLIDAHACRDVQGWPHVLVAATTHYK
jgi:hypothetical protein